MSAKYITWENTRREKRAHASAHVHADNCPHLGNQICHLKPDCGVVAEGDQKRPAAHHPQDAEDEKPVPHAFDWVGWQNKGAHPPLLASFILIDRRRPHTEHLAASVRESAAGTNLNKRQRHTHLGTKSVVFPDG